MLELSIIKNMKMGKVYCWFEVPITIKVSTTTKHTTYALLKVVKGTTSKSESFITDIKIGKPTNISKIADLADFKKQVGDSVLFKLSKFMKIDPDLPMPKFNAKYSVAVHMDKIQLRQGNFNTNSKVYIKTQEVDHTQLGMLSFRFITAKGLTMLKPLKLSINKSNNNIFNYYGPDKLRAWLKASLVKSIKNIPNKLLNGKFALSMDAVDLIDIEVKDVKEI